MKAELIEVSSNTVIPKAFKAGDIQPLQKGKRYKKRFVWNLIKILSSVAFVGLKLARMNVLKEHINTITKNNIKNLSFSIRITVSNRALLSLPFKIVSSFGQLPKNLQKTRYSRGSKHHDDDL